MVKSAVAPSLKASLRLQALQQRDGLAPKVRAAASAAIAERAIAVLADAVPGCIAAYLPIGSECDPGEVVAWARAQGIEVALPAVVDPTTIVFRRHRPVDPLEPGTFGTRGPGASAPVADPDLVIAPVVAFDRGGWRLGHGHGFYDRAIAALRRRGGAATVVGLAFAVQEVAEIPVEPHDGRLDWLVTEDETLCFRQAD